MHAVRHDIVEQALVMGDDHKGAVGRAPKAWLAELAMLGRLGVVERDGPVGKAAVYVRAADGVGRREMFDSTPPVLAGLEVRHGFAFD
jgi:protein-L-isoaspartate(D-aspartate) O-methyltransferase